jgi:signal transduction histidine kinase
LIHDARNMVSAMDLYCELLEEPGVLAFPFRHYAGELRMVSTAGRLLLERLAVAESISGLESGLESGLPIGLQPAASDPAGARLSRVEQAGATAHPKTPLESWPRTGSLPVSQSEGVPWPQRAFAEQIGGVEELWAQGGLRPVFQPGSRVRNLAEELEASRNLISALVGHGIPVTLTISGGRKPVAMTGDDLTRVLVNLARNAAEAMPCGGRLEIALEEDAEFMVLSFRDDGPGIPKEALEAIFASGYSTRGGLHAVANSRPESGQVSGADAALEFNAVSHSGRWPVQHRGLGLSIVRSIVASAGGSIWATNRGDAHGAIFVIEFPMIEPSPT